MTADVGADALLRAEVPVSTPWLRELRLGTTLGWKIDPAAVRPVSAGSCGILGTAHRPDQGRAGGRSRHGARKVAPRSR